MKQMSLVGMPATSSYCTLFRSLADRLDNAHHMFGRSHLDCTQYCNLLVGTGCCIQPAARIENSHIVGHLAGSSSDTRQLDRILLHTAEIVELDLVGRIGHLVGKSSPLVGRSLLGGFGSDLGSSDLLVLPGCCPPVRQGRLPMS